VCVHLERVGVTMRVRGRPRACIASVGVTMRVHTASPPPPTNPPPPLPATTSARTAVLGGAAALTAVGAAENSLDDVATCACTSSPTTVSHIMGGATPDGLNRRAHRAMFQAAMVRRWDGLKPWQKCACRCCAARPR
jgi:hypothetical protein